MGLCINPGPILQEFSVENPRPVLISLWDMLRFFAAEFVAVTHNLELVRHTLLDDAFSHDHVPLDWNMIEFHIAEVQDVIQKLPLSQSLKVQVARTLQRVKQRDSTEALSVLVNEISHNVVTELTSYLFFLVPSELKWLYLTPEQTLGSACESKFPEVVKDAHDGLRCYVVDQWTATVFHFMRVLEFGLRWLCKEVGLENPDVDLENWKNIIDQIEKKIRQMESLPRSRDKTDNLQFYSEAAAQFRYFKDAWRNHVSHTRANYDSRDAHRVLTHVADFMKHLASRS